MPAAAGAPGGRQVQPGTAADPLYRHDGLRLLEVGGGRLFFVHGGWTIRDGVVVLPDNNPVRTEFSREAAAGCGGG